MLGDLGSSLRSSIKRFVNKVLVDEQAIDEFLKDVQKALIRSDVDVSLVFELTKKVKARVLEKKSFSQKEQIVRILYEELVSLVGGGFKPMEVRGKPYKILLVGLFGSGKTTTSGKLALNFKKRGYKTSVLALDTYRAAAVKQLKQVAEQASVSFMGDEGAKKPEKVVKSFEKDFKSFDVVIGDSAGRDALDKDLVKEVKAINKAFKPDETLLVIPADIGQSARAQAEAFKDALNITGVIITKLDSTAKGGGALTACAVSGAPVKFIGVGEGLKDLELFKPKGFISRLLGMGDLESLLDKARLELDEDKMKEVGERFMSGQLTLLDLYEQFKAVGKMGSFQKLLSFLPGVGGMNLPMDQLGMQEENIGKFKVIMNSMTEEELMNPKVLNRSRIERVAAGSGTDVKTVRLLIKQYNQMKNVTKKLKGGNLKKMMKQLGIKDVKQLEGMMEGLQ